MKYNIINVNNNKIKYIEKGKGIPFIFIHGWSTDGEYWKKQIDYFSQFYQVIVYDWNVKSADYQCEISCFDEFVDNLAEFINLKSLKNFILCGHSLGGTMALHFAAKYPQLAQAVISADAPGEKNKIINSFGYLILKSSIALSSILFNNPLKLQIPCISFLFYSSFFKKNNQDDYQKWKNQFLNNSSDALDRSMKALIDRPKIKNTIKDVPVFLTLGKNDRLISLKETKAYQKIFLNSKFAYINNAGHMSTEEQPEEFNQLVSDFLKQNKLVSIKTNTG